MATLNIFQQYSQQENTITNNVLSLFPRLYENNPALYEQFCSGLFGDANIYSIMPSFRQQVGQGGAGIIDGHITCKSSIIVIETKKQGKENIDKLLSYCDRFKSVDSKILLHISRDVFSEAEIAGIEKRIKKVDKEIRFFSVSFENIADGLTALKGIVPYDKEIGRLEADFRSYCELFGLFTDEQYLLRAVACGESEYLNEKYFFYFDPEDRSYKPHKYIGIYYDKAVRYIGEIMAIVDAELVDGDVKIKNTTFGELTEPLKKNLKNGLIHAVEDGWKIATGHKFFLCSQLYDTDFKKISSYGIYSKRYFDLREVLNVKKLPSTDQIANILSSKTWE